jgi:hypothetical protein
MSHTTNLATHIENTLRQVLEHDANTRARETGFVQRQRKRTGSTFAQRMVFGAASNPCPTDTDWTQAAAVAGTPLTPQGIEQRFTPQAAHFLYALLQRFVERVITTCTPEVAPLLQRFAGVFIKDSTGITLPRALASVWQGLGDSRGASAAVKWQVRWNFSTGQLEGPTLQPARCHDRTTAYPVDDLPAGRLELADLGYLCLEELQAKQALGQASLQAAHGGTDFRRRAVGLTGVVVAGRDGRGVLGVVGQAGAFACAVDCVSAFGGERGSCASASVGVCREKGREAVAAGVGVGRLGSIDNECA